MERIYTFKIFYLKETCLHDIYIPVLNKEIYFP